MVSDYEHGEGRVEVAHVAAGLAYYLGECCFAEKEYHRYCEADESGVGGELFKGKGLYISAYLP